ILNSLQIPIIDTQADWSSLPPTLIKTYFRDNPHLSVAGNQAAANLLFEQLCLTRKLPSCSK
ncbi:MAG TPA: SGNH/GDSL hydrolase family protein, partial [Cyanophyceae cyanobacterium]